jgi:hypothetical protein
MIGTCIEKPVTGIDIQAKASKVMKLISPEEALRRMNAIWAKSPRDLERNHQKADDLLCEILSSLGYEKVVEKFQSEDKWYS